MLSKSRGKTFPLTNHNAFKLFPFSFLHSVSDVLNLALNWFPIPVKKGGDVTKCKQQRTTRSDAWGLFTWEGSDGKRHLNRGQKETSRGVNLLCEVSSSDVDSSHSGICSPFLWHFVSTEFSLLNLHERRKKAQRTQVHTFSSLRFYSCFILSDIVLCIAYTTLVQRVSLILRLKFIYLLPACSNRLRNLLSWNSLPLTNASSF